MGSEILFLWFFSPSNCCLTWLMHIPKCGQMVTSCLSCYIIFHRIPNRHKGKRNRICIALRLDRQTQEWEVAFKKRKRESRTLAPNLCLLSGNSSQTFWCDLLRILSRLPRKSQSGIYISINISVYNNEQPITKQFAVSNSNLFPFWPSLPSLSSLPNSGLLWPCFAKSGLLDTR